jgi:hypothetical protein
MIVFLAFEAAISKVFSQMSESSGSLLIVDPLLRKVRIL